MSDISEELNLNFIVGRDWFGFGLYEKHTNFVTWWGSIEGDKSEVLKTSKLQNDALLTILDYFEFLIRASVSYKVLTHVIYELHSSKIKDLERLLNCTTVLKSGNYYFIEKWLKGEVFPETKN